MVWRAQAQRDCWRAMERWGEGVVDPAQVGWRTAYQAYDRLHWARLLAAQSKSLYHPEQLPRVVHSSGRVSGLYLSLTRLNRSAGKADKLARSKHRSSFSVEADMSCFAVDEQSFAAPGKQ